MTNEEFLVCERVDKPLTITKTANVLSLSPSELWEKYPLLPYTESNGLYTVQWGATRITSHSWYRLQDRLEKMGIKVLEDNQENCIYVDNAEFAYSIIIKHIVDKENNHAYRS